MKGKFIDVESSQDWVQSMDDLRDLCDDYGIGDTFPEGNMIAWAE